MKHSFISLRSVVSAAIALICVAATTVGHAQTTTLQQSSTAVPLTTTDWTQTVTVPQFNTTLGTLQSVTVASNWTTFQSLSIVNQDTSTEYVYIDDSVSVAVTLPDGVTTLNGKGPDLIGGSKDTSGNPTGALTVSGTGATISQGPLTAQSTTTSTTITGSALAAYQGTGTVAFAAVGTGISSEVDSGGNILFNVTQQAGVTITVTYTYTPVGGGSAGANTGTGGTTTPTTVSISGTVYANTAGNGVAGNPGETGVGANVEVFILNSAGTVVGIAYTNAAGQYTATGLLPNTTYTVQIEAGTLPTGVTVAGPATISTTTHTANVTGADFTAAKSNNCPGYTTLCTGDWCNSWNWSCNGSNSGCLWNNWKKVYPKNDCTVGHDKSKCVFDNPRSVECYVNNCNGRNDSYPSGCRVNPTNCRDGQLACEALACQLNCSFSDAGIFKSGFKNLKCQWGKFQGCTVNQVLNAAHCYLNGDKCIPNVPHCSGDDICTALNQINTCYSSSNNWGNGNNGGWGGGGWGGWGNNNSGPFCK